VESQDETSAVRDAARSTGVAVGVAVCSCYNTASVAERAPMRGGSEGVARSTGAMMASVAVSKPSSGVAINGQFSAGLEVGGGLGFTRGSKVRCGLVEPWAVSGVAVLELEELSNQNGRGANLRLCERIQGTGGSKTPGSCRLGD
jgi:hypothetical protein